MYTTGKSKYNGKREGEYLSEKTRKHLRIWFKHATGYT